MPKYKRYNQFNLPVGRKTWSDRKYFDRFFEINKERIEYVNESYGHGRNVNPDLIYNRLQLDVRLSKLSSFRESLLKNLRTGTEFRTYKEIAIDNVMSGLDSFGRTDDFYQAITKPDGTMNFNPDLMKYVGDGTYVYDNRVMINFKNSPASVDLIILENEDYEPKED